MTPREVVILAVADDVHADAMQSVLQGRYGATTHRCDVTGLPSRDRFGFRFEDDGSEMRGGMDLGSIGIDLERVTSVWWRRPGKFQLDGDVQDQELRSFCLRETNHAFRGALACLDGRVVNEPDAERRASWKVLQLQCASRHGLKIPATLVTNSRDEVTSFVASYPEAIYKGFTALEDRLLETRILDASALKELDALRHAPIIVQEKIVKQADIRVTVVDDLVFAASVEPRIPEATLDWRLDLSARWHFHELPEPVSNKLRGLVCSLGLRTGCIDLRLTPEDEYVFFEINPTGQFLFIEVETGQEILDAFARLLLNPTERVTNA